MNKKRTTVNSEILTCRKWKSKQIIILLQNNPPNSSRIQDWGQLQLYVECASRPRSNDLWQNLHHVLWQTIYIYCTIYKLTFLGWRHPNNQTNWSYHFKFSILWVGGPFSSFSPHSISPSLLPRGKDQDISTASLILTQRRFDQQSYREECIPQRKWLQLCKVARLQRNQQQVNLINRCNDMQR